MHLDKGMRHPFFLLVMSVSCKSYNRPVSLALHTFDAIKMPGNLVSLFQALKSSLGGMKGHRQNLFEEVFIDSRDAEKFSNVET